MKYITDAITFIEGLLSREYGIRTLYFALLLIPSLSLLWLYRMSLDENASLREEIRVQKILTHECVSAKNSIKEDTRKEVMDELRTTMDLINNFKSIISENNEVLKKKAEEVSKELNKIN